jgi:hypothetical protein
MARVAPSERFRSELDEALAGVGQEQDPVELRTVVGGHEPLGPCVEAVRPAWCIDVELGPLEQLGGVPQKILFDNPKTVTLRDVAGAAVTGPELVRLAAHYRFRPQTTAFYDAPSKGKAEALVRFTKSDLIAYEGFGSLDEANAAARAWLAEVNARPHAETKRPPLELLERERPLLRALPALRPAVACREERKVDRLATVRFASARYSVPHRLVGKAVQVQATDRDLTVLSDGVPVAHHPLLAPGECSIEDAHYPSPPPRGARPLRPRTEPERAFLARGSNGSTNSHSSSRASIQAPITTSRSGYVNQEFASDNSTPS